jgi:hypothetical protein
MKQSDDLARVGICSGHVRPFVPIAMKTGECEILGRGLAPMLARDDVVNVKRQRIDGAGEMTILTTFPGALPDVPDNVPIHERRRS